MNSVTSVSYSGIWPALLTPLDETLDIDIPRVRLAMRARCSTPAAPASRRSAPPAKGRRSRVAERRDAIDGLVARGVPAERILVSTSCAALPDALALTRHALELGAHGCLMLPPFFLKGVSDQGVIDAYRWVIDGVGDTRLRAVPLSHPAGVRRAA